MVILFGECKGREPEDLTRVGRAEGKRQHKMKKLMFFLILSYVVNFNNYSIAAQWVPYAVESEIKLPAYYDNSSIVTIGDNIKLFWMSIPKDIEMPQENIPIVIKYDNTEVMVSKSYKSKIQGQSLILTEYDCDNHAVKFLKYVTYDKNNKVVSRTYSDMDFIPIVENTLLDVLFRIICK